MVLGRSALIEGVGLGMICNMILLESFALGFDI